MTPRTQRLRMSFRLPIASAWVVAGLIVGAAGTAFAGIAMSVGPNYPQLVQVTQTGVPVSLTIINNSADDPNNLNVDSQRSVTVDHVFHTPACDLTAPTCPAGSRETNVFQVVGPATGSGGATGCAGTWTFSAPDVSGEIEFTPPGGAGSLVLGPSGGTPLNARCTVTFTVSVLQSPAQDADPGAPGIQTDELGRGTCHFSDNVTITGGGSGSDSITIRARPPMTRKDKAPAMSTGCLAAVGALLLAWGCRRVSHSALGV